MKKAFYLLGFVLLAMGCRSRVASPPITPPVVQPVVPPNGGDDREVYPMKPIIYLYPSQKTEITVRLESADGLSTTYPKYNAKTGWKVLAAPDGTLQQIGSNKEFYALYWEGKSYLENPITAGFVVKGEAVAAFLEDKLTLLGLNAKERNEFMVYWLPKMQRNAYNLVHFAQENYTHQFPLNIEPMPETLIRVFMEFKALDKPIDIPEQQLIPAQRKGFTVVEWGGAQLGSEL